MNIIMKNFIFAAVAAVCAAMPSMAQETVKELYAGDPVEVTWENTLKIGAENFDTDVQVGHYISVTFEKTTDVIELKADGKWLPGTRLTNLGDDTPEVKAYITADMLAKLREFGLELCGASFTVKDVSVKNDGFNMPEGAVWGGYFWVENWNTLELFKTAFDNYNGQRYLDVYLSDDNGDNTGYFMKALTAWDNPDAVWADNDQIDHGTRIATIDLQGLDVKEKLADVSTLMIQSNPEGGSPYNITAIVLRDEEGTINISADCNDGNVNYYGTYYTDKAYVMPSGLEGYAVSVSNDELKLESAYKGGEIVPSRTALLIHATAPGTYTYVVATENGTSSGTGTDNMLKGTLTAEEMTEGEDCLFYRLTMYEGKQLGFWWGAEDGGAFAPGANNAYLAVPKTVLQANLRGFTFGDLQTAVGNVKADRTDRDDKVYDLAGRRVLSPVKGGVYIMNGKKFIK